MTTLGEKIALMRKSKGLTQEALAEKCSVSAQELKPICREIKKLLKEYKKANGSLTLVDISGTDEDGKSKICIKL